MMSPLHLPQAPQHHPHAQPQHFFQIPQVQPPMYYATTAQTYPHHLAPQPYMMPPPPYTSTAQQYSIIIPVPITTHQASDTAMRVPHMYHAPAAGYTVPMGHQTAIFDAGARFNGKAPVIPPPPPGYLPNAAQVAAMQGQSVIIEKKKN